MTTCQCPAAPDDEGGASCSNETTENDGLCDFCHDFCAERR